MEISKEKKKHHPAVFTRSGADDDAIAEKPIEKGQEEGVAD